MDTTLLGAVQRAIERNESKSSIIESLSYLGYSEIEIEEAIKVASQKEKIPLEIAPEQEKQVSKQIKEKSSIVGAIVWTLITGIVLILSVVTYIALREPWEACKTSIDREEEVFGLSFSCNVINIANAQAQIVFVIVLLAYLVSFIGKKFSK